MKTSFALLICGAMFFCGCAAEDQTTDTPAVTPPEVGMPAMELPGSVTSGEAIMTAVNGHCPIMGGEVTDEGGRTDFNGKCVGFCCPGCIDEWNELSDEDKETKLTKASSEEGHEHGEHGDHGDHEKGHEDTEGAGA
jgi:hypothetical protein